MKTRRILAAALFATLAGLVPGAAPEDQPVTGFHFDLLPRSFQQKPLVEVHVITELTPSGRLVPPPTATQPRYFLTRPSGQLALGQGAPANEKPADVARLEALMTAALAVSHYLPAGAGQAPNLVIIYSWGSHSVPLGQDDAPTSDSVGDDGETQTTAATGESPDLLVRELLERARLVGGEKFTADLIKAINAEAAIRRATPENRLDPLASPLGPVTFGLMSPMERFRNRNAKTMGLLEDIGGSIYFVVASAYDAASVAANQRVLLWRTKMTTRASGLGLGESMPSLIATAGPFFGQDMGETESIQRRIRRDGSVELAPVELLGVAEDGNQPGQERAKPSATKPAAPPKGK